MYVVYGNNVLIVAIYGLYCAFKMQFLRASLKKNPNFFPMGSFYVVLQIKYSLNCHNSKKSPMPRKIADYVPRFLKGNLFRKTINISCIIVLLETLCR